MRWYNPLMSDGDLANHWPTTGVDVRSSEQSKLVSMANLGEIVQRIRSGTDTWEDRVALVDLADEIETDAPATELAELAGVLRRIAGA